MHSPVDYWKWCEVLEHARHEVAVQLVQIVHPVLQSLQVLLESTPYVFKGHEMHE